MPKLLGPEALGERPIANPAGTIPAYRGASGAETVGGESLMKFGAALERTGNVIYEAQKVEQERFDKTAAEDAFNTLRERQLDLTVGEQNGFVNKKGKAAVDGTLYPQYTGMLDETYNELSGKLTNDRQRELFKPRAGIASLQYRENLLRHITEQGNVLAKQTTEGGLTVELKGASLAWRDPNAIAASLVRSEGLLKDQAEREGWADEILEAKTLEQKTRIHASVINNALANDNWGYAQKWYQTNKAEIVDMNGTIAKALEEGGLRSESRRLADSIFAKSQTEGQAMAEADEKTKNNAKLYDATRERIRQKFSDKQNEFNAILEKTYLDASKIVEQTGSTDGIPADKWVSVLTDKHRSALGKRAQEIRENKEPKLNEKKWMEFLDIPANKLAAMNQAEVESSYISDFDRTRRLQAMDRWATARKAATGDPLASAKYASTIQFDDIVDGYARQMKVIPAGEKKNLTAEQMEAYNNFRFAADAAIKDFERTKLQGKRVASSDEMQQIVSKTLLRKVFVENWYGGKDEKPIAAVTAKERAGVVGVPMAEIPQPDLVKIKNYARSLGANVSNRQIERAYYIYSTNGNLEDYKNVLLGKK